MAKIFLRGSVTLGNLRRLFSAVGEEVRQRLSRYDAKEKIQTFSLSLGGCHLEVDVLPDTPPPANQKVIEDAPTFQDETPEAGEGTPSAAPGGGVVRNKRKAAPKG